MVVSIAVYCMCRLYGSSSRHKLLKRSRISRIGLRQTERPLHLAQDYASIPAGPGFQFTNIQSLGIYTAAIQFTTTMNSLHFDHIVWITEVRVFVS